nr:PREDICTED: uncharacterized protein LOC109043153 [Bemisia tabaci]
MEPRDGKCLHYNNGNFARKVFIALPESANFAVIFIILIGYGKQWKNAFKIEKMHSLVTSSGGIAHLNTHISWQIRSFCHRTHESQGHLTFKGRKRSVRASLLESIIERERLKNVNFTLSFELYGFIEMHGPAAQL